MNASDNKTAPSDASSDKGAWSVRGVSIEARSAAASRAKSEDVSVGDWVTRAILAKVKADRAGGRALAAPVPVASPTVVSPSSTAQVVAEVRELVKLARDTAMEMGDEVPPKSVRNAAYRAIRQRIEGLSDEVSFVVTRRQTNGQTATRTRVDALLDMAMGEAEDAA